MGYAKAPEHPAHALVDQHGGAKVGDLVRAHLKGRK
jgi:hypothetical protein